MSTTNIPKKEDKKQIGNQVGDLGNAFIAGLVLWGTPPFAKPQNPHRRKPQNALSQTSNGVPVVHVHNSKYQPFGGPPRHLMIKTNSGTAQIKVR